MKNHIEIYPGIWVWDDHVDCDSASGVCCHIDYGNNMHTCWLYSVFKNNKTKATKCDACRSAYQQSKKQDEGTGI